MNILGINNAHNASISYGIKDEIVFALAEERISRKKFHIGFPEMSINYCLWWLQGPIFGSNKRLH